jgi:hypothetical protein
MIWLLYRDEQGWDDMNDKDLWEATRDFLMGAKFTKRVNNQLFEFVLHDDGSLTEWLASKPDDTWTGKWRFYLDDPDKYLGNIAVFETRIGSHQVLYQYKPGKNFMDGEEWPQGRTAIDVLHNSHGDGVHVEKIS